METESEQQAEDAARDILSRGVHSVLVKRGTNGSLLIDRDGEVNLALAQVVDTTGAGDCFTGAYAVAILEGKKPEEALTFAGMFASLLMHTGISIA